MSQRQRSESLLLMRDGTTHKVEESSQSVSRKASEVTSGPFSFSFSQAPEQHQDNQGPAHCWEASRTVRPGESIRGAVWDCNCPPQPCIPSGGPLLQALLPEQVPSNKTLCFALPSKPIIASGIQLKTGFLPARDALPGACNEALPFEEKGMPPHGVAFSNLQRHSHGFDGVGCLRTSFLFPAEQSSTRTSFLQAAHFALDLAAACSLPQILQVRSPRFHLHPKPSALSHAKSKRQDWPKIKRKSIGISRTRERHQHRWSALLLGLTPGPHGLGTAL